MIDVVTKLDSDICDMDAVFGKMSMFQVVIQKSKGQIALRLFILTDDEIDDALAHHFNVIRRYIVYNDMNAVNKPGLADRLIDSGTPGGGNINAA